MTFSTKVKEEIANILNSPIEARSELSAFLRYTGTLKKHQITLVIENGVIARRIYKYLKGIYNINIKILIRIQNKLRKKQIYMLEINDKVDYILNDLNIIVDQKHVLQESYYLDDNSEKVAFLKGLFLACGSISDPAKSGYHMEFTIKEYKETKFITRLFNEYGIDVKVIKRTNNYMVYLKEAEKISDILRLFGATNSLFYYEDIRIYRDHKNMVNRLNNCEIFNQEKTIKTGLKQMANIDYLKKNDLLSLLDEKTQKIIIYREKYPEMSFAELAETISMETDYKIGKSGVNHHFIKINELVNKAKNK